MSVRKIFDDHLQKQQAEIARQALRQAFRGEIPVRSTMREILDELEQDEVLWQAFNALQLGELKEMLAPPPGAFGPPGPTRKRGVTSKRIIDYVRANPGARRSDIMRALGIKGGTASSQLRTLRATGRLTSEGPERNLQYYSG